MRRVFRIQHCVVDGQLLEYATAGGGDRKPQIAPIDAIIDLDGTKSHAALSIGAGEMQMSQHVDLQRRLTCPQLAPGDFAIAVMVQAHREFAVAYRELQRPGYLCAADLQTQKTI